TGAQHSNTSMRLGFHRLLDPSGEHASLGRQWESTTSSHIRHSRESATSSFPRKRCIVIPAKALHRHSRESAASSFPRKRESSVFATNATGSPLSRGRRKLV